MNEYAILHTPDSRYCFATDVRELVIRLRMAKEDAAAKVTLICACKYDFTFDRREIPLTICYSDRLYNYYEKKLTLTDVRFAYLFQIEENGKIWYYSEDGVTETYCFEEGFYNFFQMPYINENDCMKTVEWMKDAVFYQIFIDRFFMGDKEKDKSYINLKWGELPNPKSFAGGDLKGIIEKLPYIKALGIGAIYLTPVFRSVSNHKYDTISYREVDPQFGSTQDLKELVKKAHELGIRVVLDAVFNHCSMEMEQFADVRKRGRKSPYYDWFLIRGDVPVPEKRNYECFAACEYMPKLNTANKKVQEFLIDIALYWIREADIDGWRLDVSDEVSHGFWRRFREAIKEEKEDCVIIGENWHDAYPYLRGDEYDSIMNYAFTKACLDYFARGTFDAAAMAAKLNSNLMRNLEQVNRMMLNLLDSHDTHRFYTELKKNKDRLLAAVALEMVFLGAPCLYYGTEICMEGGYDPDSRRCFNWNEDEWEQQVLEQIKGLIALHHNPAIRDGAIAVYEESGMLVTERTVDGQRITLYINLTGESKSVREENRTLLMANRRENAGRLQTDGYAIYLNGQEEQ